MVFFFFAFGSIHYPEHKSVILFGFRNLFFNESMFWIVQEIERRRAMMRQRAVERKNEEMEVMEVEEEGKSGDESESESEYEEFTDSEDEAEPRLKPVFIRK